MSQQLPKLYRSSARFSLFPVSTVRVPCPECGVEQIAQRGDQLIDPGSGKIVYSPESLILIFAVIGLVAAGLIVVGGWLALAGVLLEVGVVYGALVCLPVAFRAREVQLFHFQCKNCTTQWSASLF